MVVRKPSPAELSDYYRTYLKYVPENDLLSSLKKQSDEMELFFSSVPGGMETMQYAEGKWMLKEVAGHLCDTERILAYRALRISRNDTIPLHGFDENNYTLDSNYKSRILKNILEEFIAVRKANILLFENMNEEMFDRKGVANDSEVSVRGLLFFIVAHARHHMGVIRERYLK
jgi:hypothetical protein